MSPWKMSKRGVDRMLYMVISIAGVSLLLVGYLIGKAHYKKQLARMQKRAEDIIRKAKKEAESLKREKMLEGTQEIQERQEKLEQRMEERKKELKQMEERTLRREDRLEKKSSKLENMEKIIVKNGQMTKELVKKGKMLLKEERKKLEKIADLSSKDARKQLLTEVEKESTRFFSQKINEAKEKAQEEAEKEARKIIATAISRYGADQVEESTVTSVPLPNDDYKGRIIGREGRNIRTFEALTGVEVLVDDTPEAVVLSCFHPIRREIARMAMERLVEDGRIHPAHIKKQVDKAKEKMEEKIKEDGQKAVFDLGLDGIHPELVSLIGRLNYRTSYGQNQLKHSMEVSFIARILAEELGIDPIPSKRAGILHDIGKAVDHKVEGPHPLISADLARRYGESEEIVHAIEAHNEDVEAESMLAVLIQAADTLSAARPGARQDALESYIQRLENLEKIGSSFPGVKEAYCIQAGREIRIMVNPEEISDDSAARLSYKIARTIEEKMDYPGEIKVNVIRKTQFQDRAK